MDLSDWIERQAAFAPAKTALVCADRRLPYADLAATVRQAAAATTRWRGTTPGHRRGGRRLARTVGFRRLGATPGPVRGLIAPAAAGQGMSSPSPLMPATPGSGDRGGCVESGRSN